MEQEVIQLHRFEDRFAHEEPFNIRQIRASAQQIDQGHPLPPHRHDFYEICLFGKARGVHHIDWQPYPIQDRAVFVLSPEAVHLVDLQGEVDGYIICLHKGFVLASPDASLPTALAFFEQYSPFFTVAGPDFAGLQLTAEQLLREAASPAIGHEVMFRAYVQVLLIQLLRCRKLAQEEVAPAGKNQVHEKMVLFKALLEEHYKEHYSVQQYAARLALSTKQLNRLCKQSSGKTASALIQERLNAESKRLLYNTLLSIKEISFALGFREPSHFSHFFYKQNGLFPHFFREMMLNAKE
ncbi:AraC family transcriptional regulator [Hymenobacter weizhouensis]|uniref:AraC family transcriptional regulator n=1 Tax=Hymenobacter sp. YIM 151500-1 TaxID=2987689 RepID=UPI0022271E36|nr:helix-turn-helix transcriptional regulator [Hymenobacter sp. YIM 151500-1]UYZ63101.1 helix-turn-helix transcriptional regulator [Hymenobacter sp. YIM 151500-1]